MSSGRESLTAGFDVGGTSVRAALVAVDGRLVGSTIDEPRRPDALGQVQDLRERLVADAAADGRPVVRTGLCIAGSVDASTARIVSAPTAPALIGLQPRAPGSGLDIDALANDANAALVGEWRFGAARGVGDAVGIFVGTGVGGAAIIAGRQLLGASGVALEVGHIVVDPDGPSCACGGAGCLEQVASGTALARRFSEATGEPADARAAARAARAGNPAAVSLFSELGHRLGTAVATLANLFNPEVVVIGGGVADVSDLFLGDLRAAARKHMTTVTGRDARIVVGGLGRFAGVTGAAALASTGVWHD
ncbi:ROK family protein [Streptomyces sp. NPDC088864]|uniref:ROK family protein n=1 Tax=Streptomyces sp. NPDC088864 TaxID=3365910 RepID=UPI00381BA1E6